MSDKDVDHAQLTGYRELPPDEMHQRAESFLESMKSRRSVRSFSSRPVDRKVIELCIQAAGRAPSGANQQPWKFVVVSDPSLKAQIRQAAEKEERAPYLVVVFCENYRLDAEGKKIKHLRILAFKVRNLRCEHTYSSATIHVKV